MSAKLIIKSHNFNNAVVIAKHKAKNEKRYKLLDGRIVIGEEADQNNQLWYIIDGNLPTIEPAIGQTIIETYIKPKVFSRIMTIKSS